jgi:hypothetical protein
MRVVAGLSGMLCLLGSVSCNDLVQASRASTILVIERIGAKSGGTTATHTGPPGPTRSR